MLIIDTGLFQKNGQLLAMKGDWLKEKQTPPKGYEIANVEQLTVPHIDGARHLVILKPVTRADA
jgi:16S rRNA G527 N7-methylase RsmG